MQIVDSDVPFFPFDIKKKGTSYCITNHLLANPVYLNRMAAEVLRLSDGVTSLSDIVKRVANRYPDSGGPEIVKSQIVKLLSELSSKELIWWRNISFRQILVEPPSTVFWEITAACNLQCLHCVVNAGTKLKNELSYDQCIDFAIELATFGVKNIAFSGGEPLIHPHFLEIARRVRELGMTIQLATNGTLITPNIAKELKDLEVQVQVSLDGSTAEIHELLRPGQNAYARTIDGAKSLINAGHQITIGTVLTTLNYHDIQRIMALAQEIGAAEFRIIPFIPKGRGQFNKELELPPEKVKEVAIFLHSMRDKTRINIAPIEFEEVLQDVEPNCRSNPDLPLKCGGAIEYATVTPEGSVLPCHFFYGVRADNIKFNKFSQIWNCSRFLNYFRSLRIADLKGNCSECKWLPTCAGSCRAANFAKGNLFEGNISCWVSKD